jgi:two-component system chemotaxis sensor kinase CheA
MVGELVIAQSMIAQDPNTTSSGTPQLTRKVSQLGKIARELQDLTVTLRMVPLQSAFQKLRRLARDLARKIGKSVDFVTEGEDTEIDRNMVEAISDPLLHMIRNAVDHGIENREARRTSSKPETGTISLRAYHSAGSVVIEVHDDGRGLDREKIIAKAEERGLIEPGRSLSDREAFALLFQPGFSTAAKITDVSGRGVGLDVVKRGIDALRGRIELSSVPGQGTTFKMSLPLTLAITDAMLIRVGKERYLLPTVSIKQSFRPEPAQLSTVGGRGEMVLLRDDLIPIVRLHRLLGVEDASTDMSEGLLIVIESEGRQTALLVDDLLAQQQVVIKSLGGYLGSIPGIAGGAILGDGRVGLILDPTAISSLAQREELTLPIDEDPPLQEATPCPSP